MKKKSELLRRMKKIEVLCDWAGYSSFVTLAAFTSPLFVVHDPIQSDLRKRLISPEFLANGINGYILGTDALGQDIFYKTGYGLPHLFVNCSSRSADPCFNRNGTGSDCRIFRRYH
ncbi:hypothetical protein [Lacrimispora xylanisolvens]|uniref:hypothetical protein n=1 Tax=Lacrimispora xylanisolvens TaxID=384636 RepID=UPI00240281AC